MGWIRLYYDAGRDIVFVVFHVPQNPLFKASFLAPKKKKLFFNFELFSFTLFFIYFFILKLRKSGS